MGTRPGAPELELRDYLRVLHRRKWLILAVVALVAATSTFLSVRQTPIYQSSAELLLQARVSESLFDTSGAQFYDRARVVETEIQVLRSRPVRDRARQDLGFEGSVAASPVGDTDVIRVTAESSDPERAADVANAFSRAYIDFRRTQAVDDLFAAAEQIQSKIADIETRLEAAGGPEVVAPPRAAGTATTDSLITSERESLLQQRALFRQKLDQLQVDAALKSGGAQLVTPAVASIDPIRPTPRRTALLGLVVGLLLGVGLAFLREYLDDSVKGREDVERAAPGLTILGFIPALPGWKDRSRAYVATVADPTSPAAEAYRSLRTSIQFIGLERPLRTIQVTSPSASEGKSTTIANLAITLASTGKRVVVVDGDLRRPRVHEFFGLRRDHGLTSVLLGDLTLPDALQAAATRIHVLASGPIPPNPSELLAGTRMRQTLEKLREHADIVLVDCPPVLPVTDATVLAHVVDGTILVTSVGSTKQPQLKRACEVLDQVGAPLIGVVLNGVSTTGEYGYGGSYRYAESDAGRDESRRSAAPAAPSSTVRHEDASPPPPPPPPPPVRPEPAPATTATATAHPETVAPAVPAPPTDRPESSPAETNPPAPVPERRPDLSVGARPDVWAGHGFAEPAPTGGVAEPPGSRDVAR